MIGNVFVQQYYSIMSTTLDELYKFYNNGSTLHVCGVGVPPLPGADAMGDQTVRTQAGIHARFNQLGYRGKRCEVRTVDSSHSIGGSVVVMVTGAITDGGVDRRAFTQTFVLAPQEGGYYVLNDLVRFLGNDEGAAAVAADTAVSAPVKAPEPPVTAPPAPTRPTGAVSLEELEARMNAAAPNVHARAAAAADVVKEAAEAAAAAEVVKETSAAIVEPETDAKEPEGPTTYASIAAKMRAAAAAKAPNVGVQAQARGSTQSPGRVLRDRSRPGAQDDAREVDARPGHRRVRPQHPAVRGRGVHRGCLCEDRPDRHRDHPDRQAGSGCLRRRRDGEATNPRVDTRLCSLNAPSRRKPRSRR